MLPPRSEKNAAHYHMYKISSTTFYNGHMVNILADLQTSENMELHKKSKCQNPKDQTIFFYNILDILNLFRSATSPRDETLKL